MLIKLAGFIDIAAIAIVVGISAFSCSFVDDRSVKVDLQSAVEKSMFHSIQIQP